MLTRRRRSSSVSSGCWRAGGVTSARPAGALSALLRCCTPRKPTPEQHTISFIRCLGDTPCTSPQQSGAGEE